MVVERGDGGGWEDDGQRLVKVRGGVVVATA